MSTQDAINQAIAQFGGNLPTFIAVLLAWINSNARISDVNSKLNELRSDLNQRLASENQNTREILRAEFRRVEEVMDARLKHLEERER